MSELDELLAWSKAPVPEVLQQLQPQQQQEVHSWAKNLVDRETEGLDDLYNAIAMIVKYIPNFMVIPLMVEHIRPRIAAQVCIKMGIDQSTGYANDLPLEYFSKVSSHLDEKMMAQILTKMKRSQVEPPDNEKLVVFRKRDLRHLKPATTSGTHTEKFIGRQMRI